MVVTTSIVLRLTFTTADGKTLAITLLNPREDLQQAGISLLALYSSFPAIFHQVNVRKSSLTC
ncbi:DUF2922 family protein [Desulfosporosinus sp. BICA1-9]|uniref:DUF2922 family protein n=1 Tax=Desulfosporosinus sp. BICA1-9 TaxID=1531958 RepID=UPI000E93A274|nr:DUF2922 family protein [Desulfosporosinus sp. BICA1-9]HBV85080.1 hypothetical protein [Desulfosporosinus sp.]